MGVALDAEKRSGQGEKDLGAKVDCNPMRVEKRFGQGKRIWAQRNTNTRARSLRYTRVVKKATRTNVCITKSEIPLHTCLPFMAGAPQGAYVVILGISLGNILYITKPLELL